MKPSWLRGKNPLDRLFNDPNLLAKGAGGMVALLAVVSVYGWMTDEDPEAPPAAAVAAFRDSNPVFTRSEPERVESHMSLLEPADPIPSASSEKPKEQLKEAAGKDGAQGSADSEAAVEKKDKPAGSSGSMAPFNFNNAGSISAGGGEGTGVAKSPIPQAVGVPVDEVTNPGGIAAAGAADPRAFSRPLRTGAIGRSGEQAPPGTSSLTGSGAASGGGAPGGGAGDRIGFGGAGAGGEAGGPAGGAAGAAAGGGARNPAGGGGQKDAKPQSEENQKTADAYIEKVVRPLIKLEKGERDRLHTEVSRADAILKNLDAYVKGETRRFNDYHLVGLRATLAGVSALINGGGGKTGIRPLLASGDAFIKAGLEDAPKLPKNCTLFETEQPSLAGQVKAGAGVNALVDATILAKQGAASAKAVLDGYLKGPIHDYERYKWLYGHDGQYYHYYPNHPGDGLWNHQARRLKEIRDRIVGDLNAVAALATEEDRRLRAGGAPLGKYGAGKHPVADEAEELFNVIEDLRDRIARRYKHHSKIEHRKGLFEHMHAATTHAEATMKTLNRLSGGKADPPALLFDAGKTGTRAVIRLCGSVHVLKGMGD